MFCLIGLDTLGELPKPHELSFVHWVRIHRTHLLTDAALNKLQQAISAQNLDKVRALPKDEFFELVMGFIADGTIK
jgi:hypothetical protein